MIDNEILVINTAVRKSEDLGSIPAQKYTYGIAHPYFAWETVLVFQIYSALY